MEPAAAGPQPLGALGLGAPCSSPLPTVLWPKPCWDSQLTPPVPPDPLVRHLCYNSPVLQAGTRGTGRSLPQCLARHTSRQSSVLQAWPGHGTPQPEHGTRHQAQAKAQALAQVEERGVGTGKGHLKAGVGARGVNVVEGFLSRSPRRHIAALLRVTHRAGTGCHTLFSVKCPLGKAERQNPARHVSDPKFQQWLPRWIQKKKKTHQNNPTNQPNKHHNNKHSTTTTTTEKQQNYTKKNKPQQINKKPTTK